LGTKLPPNTQRPFDPYKTYRITFLDKKLDESYDFRDVLRREGIQRVNFIRDQGDCASSWAFSTIGIKKITSFQILKIINEGNLLKMWLPIV
jgi:C1A family cysteine protease